MHAEGIDIVDGRRPGVRASGHDRRADRPRRGCRRAARLTRSGPVDQDPEAVREQACRIVSSNDRVCSPATTSRRRPAMAAFVRPVVARRCCCGCAHRRRGRVAGPRRAVRWRRAGGAEVAATANDAESDDLDELELAAVAVDRSREPVNWRAEADEHRRDGRFREALRCRYRALVGDLARRGLIDEIPGRTTGEERAQLRVIRPVAGAAVRCGRRPVRRCVVRPRRRRRPTTTTASRRSSATCWPPPPRNVDERPSGDRRDRQRQQGGHHRAAARGPDRGRR